MKLIRVSVIFFISLFVFSCNTNKIDLSLKLEKGKIYTQKVKIGSIVDQNLGDEVLNMEMSTESSISFKVNDQIDDYYKLKVEYTDLMVSMLMPQGNLIFRSKNPIKGDNFSLLLAEICNKPFDLSLSNKGDLIDISGVDEIFNFNNEQYNGMSTQQILQIKNQLKKAFGADALKANLKLLNIVYPKTSIDLESKWESNNQLEFVMLADVNSFFEISKNNPTSVLIEGESVIVTKDKNTIVMTDGMPLKYDLSGSMNSQITINKSTGWIEAAIITQSIQGNAFVTPNPRMPEGLKIPMKITNSYNITN